MSSEAGLIRLTDGDLVGGGVGADPEVLAVGQDGITPLSDEGEGSGEVDGADGAGHGGDGGNGELHCDGWEK